jgi:putative aldouronate transport system permease protein
VSKKTRGGAVFHVLNYSFMVLLCVAFLYPFVYTIAISLSSPGAIVTGKVWLFPVGFTTAAYQALLRDRLMIASFVFTVALTVSGVAASIVATILTAYPLSRRNFKAKNLALNLIIFTMYFSGGLIPTYFVVKRMGLMDKMAALILPNLVSSFLLFIMINYFRGLPVEMEESARIDGADHVRILLWIVIPLSTAIIATLTIYYAVSYWNTFFAALLYMSSPQHYTLQVKLYNMLSNMDIMTNPNDQFAGLVLPENLKGAVVIVTATPILVVYPFLQQYFIKGVTIGALKG